MNAPCLWCGRPATRRVDPQTDQDVLPTFEESEFGTPGVPCCDDCRRRRVQHRAEDAQSRYVRDAKIAGAVQMDLGC